MYQVPCGPVYSVRSSGGLGLASDELGWVSVTLQGTGNMLFFSALLQWLKDRTDGLVTRLFGKEFHCLTASKKKERNGNNLQS